MKRIRVTVTQDDIDRGRPHTTYACPLALALRRSGFPRADVVPTVWWPNGFGGAGSAFPSTRATAFARRYDLGRPVKPATFLLPVPE